MVYVKTTNNKGKDGYYELQYTKMPTDEQGKIWMRYYMKEKGMPPREALKNFWNDTVEVTRMQVGMISGASRTPSIPRGGPIGKPTAPKSPSVAGRGPTTKPSVKVNTGSKAQNTGAYKKDTVKPPTTSKPEQTKASKTNRMSRPAQEIQRDIDKVGNERNDVKDVAADKLREAGKLRGTDLRGRDIGSDVLKKLLGDLAKGGDKNAEGLLRELEDLDRKLKDLNREIGNIK